MRSPFGRYSQVCYHLICQSITKPSPTQLHRSRAGQFFKLNSRSRRHLCLMLFKLHKNQTPHILKLTLSRFSLQLYIPLDMKKTYPIHQPRAIKSFFPCTKINPARKNLTVREKSRAGSRVLSSIFGPSCRPRLQSFRASAAEHQSCQNRVKLCKYVYLH